MEANAYNMVDTALRIVGIELVRAVVWGGMGFCLVTYGVLLRRWLRK